MRVLLATHSLPQPSANGGPMTCWAVMQELLARGHEVTVAALQYANDAFVSPERRETVLKQGAALVTVPVPPRASAGVAERARRFALPTMDDLFPGAGAAPLLSQMVAQRRPEAVFAYHWDTLVALRATPQPPPRLGAVGDPWHLPRLRRWQSTRSRSPKEAVGVLRDRLRYPRAMARLLAPCAGAASFQPAFAEELRRSGVPECAYYPTPLEDRAGPRWRERRAASEREGAPVRVLVGPSNLEATSTRAGLSLLATSMLPLLRPALSQGILELRIVGEGLPPPELARELPLQGVELMGRIEPADAEFLAAPIQLVPTPFVLGVRVRIVSAMSFGCCIVAHTSEQANIPELRDGENCLLGSDAAALSQALLRVVGDPDLRQRLGRNARRTFESVFDRRVAAGRIANDLEGLADGHGEER